MNLSCISKDICPVAFRRLAAPESIHPSYSSEHKHRLWLFRPRVTKLKNWITYLSNVLTLKCHFSDGQIRRKWTSATLSRDLVTPNSRTALQQFNSWSSSCNIIAGFQTVNRLYEIIAIIVSTHGEVKVADTSVWGRTDDGLGNRDDSHLRRTNIDLRWMMKFKGLSVFELDHVKALARPTKGFM